MRFPNKMVKDTYDKAIGHQFTWSPSRQVFTDENKCSTYNYWAMLWLKENGFMVMRPIKAGNLVCVFEIKT